VTAHRTYDRFYRSARAVALDVLDRRKPQER
jgi:hypothetical protein